MLHLTAIVHTHNDALRLGRCLETLYPCDEILIVDRGSLDHTLRVAREYGAKVIADENGLSSNRHARISDESWVLCLDPRESLTEALAASLFEWKSDRKASAEAYSFFLREEKREGWFENPSPQTRLVPRQWNHWEGQFPVHHQASVTLAGELLRFEFP